MGANAQFWYGALSVTIAARLGLALERPENPHSNRRWASVADQVDQGLQVHGAISGEARSLLAIESGAQEPHLTQAEQIAPAGGWRLPND